MMIRSRRSVEVAQMATTHSQGCAHRWKSALWYTLMHSQVGALMKATCAAGGNGEVGEKDEGVDRKRATAALLVVARDGMWRMVLIERAEAEPGAEHKESKIS